MGDKKEVLLSFDFGPNNGVRDFYSLDDLQKWIETERTAWSWVQEQTRVDNNLNATWGKLNQHFNQIRNQIQSVVDSSDGDQNLEQLKNRLRQAYQHDHLVLSDSPRGQAILQLHEDGDSLRAAFLLGYWTKASFQPGKPSSFEAAVLATLFDAGIEDLSDSEKRSLRAMRASWERVFKEQVSEWDNKLTSVHPETVKAL